MTQSKCSFTIRFTGWDRDGGADADHFMQNTERIDQPNVLTIRLPVLDQRNGNVLYILTHKRILRFLFLYVSFICLLFRFNEINRFCPQIHDMPQAKYLQHSILDLKIGTYDLVEVASEETPIIEALHKFVNKRVSALPIVDKDGRLVDIYAKFDVINLAAEKTYSNLDISLKAANQHRNEWFEGVHKCKQVHY